MGIFALISTVLEILKEFLTWQVALTKIKAKSLAYDIDQAQLQKGRELLAKIDAARDAGDLTALRLYLDDQADAAFYSTGIRSAIPYNAGRDNLGVGSGISEGTSQGSGSDNGTQSGKSVPRAEPVGCGISVEPERNFINFQPTSKPPTKV
jgi:hypothetical protein